MCSGHRHVRRLAAQGPPNKTDRAVLSPRWAHPVRPGSRVRRSRRRRGRRVTKAEGEGDVDMSAPQKRTPGVEDLADAEEATLIAPPVYRPDHVPATPGRPAQAQAVRAHGADLCARSKCSGCDKPFTAARKPRERARQAFISTTPGSAGRTGIAPVVLCGACRARLRDGVSPFELPAMAKSAEALEMLVLADRTGPLQ